MSELSSVDAATRFVERMGVALGFFGLSRNAGRIVAYLIAHPGSHGFDDLTGGLGISRGSVSMNTRQLESMGVVERLSRPGERSDFFRLTPDAQARFLEAWLGRLREVESILHDALGALPEDSRPHERIRETERFYHDVAERLRACVREHEPASPVGG